MMRSGPHHIKTQLNGIEICPNSRAQVTFHMIKDSSKWDSFKAFKRTLRRLFNRPKEALQV
ncbi:hypothetical protein V6Z12_D01G159700 [Gossypium hirsutum]